jgi:hypothetical protein
MLRPVNIEPLMEFELKDLGINDVRAYREWVDSYGVDGESCEVVYHDVFDSSEDLNLYRMVGKVKETYKLKFNHKKAPFKATI